MTQYFFSQYILAPLAGLFVGFGTLLWAKLVRKGKPLTSTLRAIPIYGGLFTTGMVYAMAWDDKLASALSSSMEDLWVPLSVAWGFVLASVALWRYKRHRRETTPEN